MAEEPDIVGPRTTPKSVLACVLVVALAAHALCLAGSRLWVYPDSIDYIQLAGGLADRFDLTQELFLIRTPAYPFLLAGIFHVFGSSSPTAILLVQHGMAIATALLAAAIAWRVSRRSSIALLSGLLCASSLQALAYANLVLTETPYALSLLACVYFLVRYLGEGGLKSLAFASILAGVSYLLRPIGLHLVGACVAAVGLELCLRRPRRRHSAARLSGRGVFARTAVAVAPAALVVAPWSVTNSMLNGGVEATRCLDYVFYQRAAGFDGLDSATSPAMLDIHRVLDVAKHRGVVPPDASYRDRGAVLKAYQAVRGSSFAECSEIMGRAGRDLMREHPREIVATTVKYSIWMLQSPDPVHRFQPGGAPGVMGKRAASADIYDIATYSRGPGSWEAVLRQHEHYLPLTTTPAAATPLWTGVNRWFHRHIGVAEPLLGILDSRYEQFIALCGLGGLISFGRRNRALWALIALVVVSQVAVSAFLGGPQTRYALPIRPLVLLYFALLLSAAAGGLRQAMRRTRHRQGAIVGFDRAPRRRGVSSQIGNSAIRR